MIYATDVAISLASTLANPGVYVLSLNGMYDPDTTGTGHQPRGFDQLMLLYDHYVVTHARVRVSFANSSTAVPAIGFVCVRDNATPSTNHTDYMESTNTTYKSLGVESSSSSVSNITVDVNPPAFLGRRDPLSDPQLKGSNATNPDEGCSIHIGAYSSDLFTTSSVLMQAVIEYTAVLIEPKQVAQS
jgi:hypothetical protein